MNSVLNVIITALAVKDKRLLTTIFTKFKNQTRDLGAQSTNN